MAFSVSIIFVGAAATDKETIQTTASISGILLCVAWQVMHHTGYKNLFELRIRESKRKKDKNVFDTMYWMSSTVIWIFGGLFATLFIVSAIVPLAQDG